MRNYIVKLPAGQDVQIGGLNADYMRIIDGSDRLSVTPDELQPLEGMQKGMSYRTAQAFSRLTLRSEVDQNVEIMIGFGNISDDRLNISGSIDASSKGANWSVSAVTVTTSAAQIVTANQSRRSLMIKNMSATESVYINNSAAVSALTGWEIEPGEALIMDKSPAVDMGVYAIAAASAADVRILEEYD